MASPNGASKIDDDVTNVLMAVSGKVTNASRRKVAIIELELKDSLKQVSTHVEIESRAAISHILAKLERHNSEALRSVVTCRALLHSRVARLVAICSIRPSRWSVSIRTMP